MSMMKNSRARQIARVRRNRRAGSFCSSIWNDKGRGTRAYEEVKFVNIGAETETTEYKKTTGELKEAIISIAAIRI